MFKKAERKRAKLRLGLVGPSGAGKTYSALKIAKGLGGKVVLIDTENGSGELYADLLDYDVATIESPYDPKKYTDLVHAAEKAGYNVIIIDSLSHAWAGTGGLLDQQSAQAKAQKNSYTAWREITPKHNNLVDTIIASKSHIIATMRSKTHYDIVEDERGRKKPVKLGLAPIQREGMDYEFTTVFEIDQTSHMAVASKDRTSMFSSSEYMPINEGLGERLKQWLEFGKELTCEDTAELKFEQAKKKAEVTDRPDAVNFYEVMDRCETIEELDTIINKYKKLLNMAEDAKELKAHYDKRRHDIMYLTKEDAA